MSGQRQSESIWVESETENERESEGLSLGISKYQNIEWMKQEKETRIFKEETIQSYWILQTTSPVYLRRIKIIALVNNFAHLLSIQQTSSSSSNSHHPSSIVHQKTMADPKIQYVLFCTSIYISECAATIPIHLSCRSPSTSIDLARPLLANEKCISILTMSIL